MKGKGFVLGVCGLLALGATVMPTVSNAEYWQTVQIADSIAAQTADTFYLDLQSPAYNDVFHCGGLVDNILTGATDGAWSFDIIWDGRIYPLKLYWNDAGAVWTLAAGNTRKGFWLSSVLDDDVGGQTLIFGDYMRIIWTPNAVTGGYTSLWLFYRVDAKK